MSTEVKTPEVEALDKEYVRLATILGDIQFKSEIVKTDMYAIRQKKIALTNKPADTDTPVAPV